MATVTVVVVTYNAVDWVPRCLAAVREHATQHTVDLVVLDNHSTEFTPAQLEEWAGPKAQVVALDTNIGFAAGCNRGAEHGTGDYILLLNPDAVLSPGAIDALVDLHRSRPEMGIVGGRTLAPDGQLDRNSCRGQQTLWSLLCFATGASTLFPGSGTLNPEDFGRWPRDSTRRVGCVTGCLLLVDRPLWDRLGGFDERFFMYGEDEDLAVRAGRLGRQSWITPDAQAVHALGASSTALSKQILLFRGKATLLRGRYRGWSRRWGLALLTTGVALRAGGELVTRRDRGAWLGLWAQREQWLPGW